MKKNFIDEIKRMRSEKPNENSEYYCITFLGENDGKITISCISNWNGFTDTKPRREMRKAALVKPYNMLEFLNSIGEPALLVNNQFDFQLFMLFGGHGVIERTIAEKYLKNIIEPTETVFSYANGNIVATDLPENKLQRAPTKKTRLKIINRDNRKCRICGRSPKNYVDVELHVHHIMPWSFGGITEEENLITVCKTCHDGLDPHFDTTLYSLIDIGYLDKRLKGKGNYINGIRNYQKISFKVFLKERGQNHS